MKYSLHIGLDRVSPAAYGGWNGALSDCVLDANNMRNVALKNGYQVTMLLNANACNPSVRDALKGLASLAVSGDRVLITYSGHGGQLADTNGDELDKMDETWCLFDGELTDDAINNLLAKFRAGVEVVVLSDSCHSGTVSRMMKRRKATKEKAVLAEVKASVLLISGCQDVETSASTGHGGAFTNAFLESYQPKEKNGIFDKVLDYFFPKPKQAPNMGELYKRILVNIRGQKPNWYETGLKTNWKLKSVF